MHYFQKHKWVCGGKARAIDEIDTIWLMRDIFKYLIGVDLGGNQGDKKGTTMQFTGIKRGYNGVDFIDHHIVKGNWSKRYCDWNCWQNTEWYVQIK